MGQLIDAIERNLDVNNPDKTISPDCFEVLINNQVFITHAQAVKNLEKVLATQVQRYVADSDYELMQPRVSLHILSSATLSKRKTDIRCWFSSEDALADSITPSAKYQLKVVSGEGRGMDWALTPGNTYKIGRLSSADISLPFDNISKTQATLYFVSEDNIVIVDEGSANGTFIDDEQEQIQGSRDLKFGSKIQFCQIDPIVLTLAAE